MDEYGVSNPWQFLYPQTKRFSFFSPVHHSFSHIDFFLLDDRLLSHICTVSYNPIVISDAPVSLVLSFPEKPNSHIPWRFNSLLLSDKSFINFISVQIDIFVSTIVSPGVSTSLIWETFKAFIRGQIIGFSGLHWKRRRECQAQHLAGIAQLEDEYVSSPTPESFKRLITFISKFDILATEKAEAKLSISIYKYLGVAISPKFNNLLKINFETLFSRV